MQLNTILYSVPSFCTVLSIYAINNYDYMPIYCLAIVLLITLALSGLALIQKDNRSFKYKSVEPSEFVFFPAYMSLYVIALMLEWNGQSWFILFLLFIVWFRLESACYFNIVWSILGYRYYRVTTPDGTVVNVISKHKDWKMPIGAGDGNLPEINQLVAINNFTYIQSRRINNPGA